MHRWQPGLQYQGISPALPQGEGIEGPQILKQKNEKFLSKNTPQEFQILIPEFWILAPNSA